MRERKSVTIFIFSNVYRRALKLYPRDFQQKYGDELCQVFEDWCTDVLEEKGQAALLSVWLSATGDLLATATQLHVTRLFNQLVSQRRYIMPEQRTSLETHRRPSRFADRVTAVLGEEPAYYPLLLHMKTARTVGAVADSLALDADPQDTATTYALFSELVNDEPEESVPLWLERMCNVARSQFRSTLDRPSLTTTEQIARRIYDDETLFELIAAEEVGVGTVAVIESLVLDGNVEDVEEMLALMHELTID